MWFKPANPDQTFILIGEKHPGSTFECLWSQLLSMTDRQRHVRRASFDIMFCSAYQHKSVVNRFPLFIYLFISSKFPAVGPWQACRVVIFFFPKEEAVESIWRSECVFFPFFFKNGASRADIIPAPAAPAEGGSPVAPCRAAVSIVCLHSEWLRALFF